MHIRPAGFLKTFGARLGAGIADELLDRWFPLPTTFLQRFADALLTYGLPLLPHFLASLEPKASPSDPQASPPPAPGIAPPIPSMKVLGEFTCPRCGGHTWSTFGFDENGTYERHCTNGLLTAYPEHNPNTVKTPCMFKWKATDDHLYFAKPSTEEAQRVTGTVTCAPPDEFHTPLSDYGALVSAVGERRLFDETTVQAAARLLTEADAFIAKQSKQIEDLILDNVFPAGKGEIGLMLSAEMAKKIGLRYAENAPPIRVALVLDGWQWAVRIGLGRVGGELIKVDWAKADELLRDAKTAWLCNDQTAMAQNAAGGVA